MKKHLKKLLTLILVCAMVIPVVKILGDGTMNAHATKRDLVEGKNAQDEVILQSTNIPKYIFLFIGDGMSYPQIQATSYYLGASQSNGGVATKDLGFMNFPVAGSAKTFDSTSFCPDSASTATSISTGYKTHSGVINMDTTLKKKYETVSEKLKNQLGYKIGIISSVNLNHATPAAFYAHQPSRNNYYEIGLEMIASDFDYLAGGALLRPTGNKNDQPDLHELAKKAGYRVLKTQAAVEKLTKKDGKAIVIAEKLADSSSMSYELDAAKEEWKLADYVKKGIEVLEGDDGFFMMVEGGKIDWACHANDAASTIYDTIALSNAVDVALDFYYKNPNDTLILVTGDHETGGLTIGFAGTNYDTFLTNIQNQKISYAKFDSDYVTKYKKEKTSFDSVMRDVEMLFGLVPPKYEGYIMNKNLILTDYEYSLLQDAYWMTYHNAKAKSQKELVLYGTYEPLTVTITHILNNKSGIHFSSYAHTGVPVPVFALGNGADLFKGYYDNTDIYKKLSQLTTVR